MSDDARISPYERRRRAPLHFFARADNARFTAYVLSKAPELDAISGMANNIGFRGPLWSATYEAFVREASLSLELITKAVIAQRLEVGEKLEVGNVPTNHNVPKLWDQAKLPKLSEADHGRLVQARVYLMWGSRYPAPKKDDVGDRDADDLWRYTMEPDPSSPFVRKPRSFDWADIDRIYSIAGRCLSEIMKAHR